MCGLFDFLDSLLLTIITITIITMKIITIMGRDVQSGRSSWLAHPPHHHDHHRHQNHHHGITMKIITIIILLLQKGMCGLFGLLGFDEKEQRFTTMPHRIR